MAAHQRTRRWINRYFRYALIGVYLPLLCSLFIGLVLGQMSIAWQLGWLGVGMIALGGGLIVAWAELGLARLFRYSLVGMVLAAVLDMLNHGRLDQLWRLPLFVLSLAALWGLFHFGKDLLYDSTHRQTI